MVMLSETNIADRLAEATELGRIANTLFHYGGPAAEFLEKKRKELEALESLCHDYALELPKEWPVCFFSAESWNTYARMLNRAKLPDHYALAMSFVKYRDSNKKFGKSAPKSWEFVSFLIYKKQKDSNWPSQNMLLKEATQDFKEPVIAYILKDLETFTVQEVLDMRPSIKALALAQGFYIQK